MKKRNENGKKLSDLDAQMLVVRDFIDEFYSEGGIIADYQVSNRLDSWLPTTKYEWRLFDKGDLKEPFTRFPNQSILAFHVAGI